MENKIKEWLDKSGYSLELRTEKILRRQKFAVYNSQTYEDSETKREIDLIAERSITKSEITVSVNLIIECKKSSNPFILLKASKSPHNYFTLYTNHYADEMMIRPALYMSKSIHILKESENHVTGFKIVQAFSNSDETIYKAGLTLCKALYAHRAIEEQSIDSYIDDQVYTITIPLLVIDAPFYSATLDENLNIELIKIDSAIWRSHQISTKSDDFSVIVSRIENLEAITKRIINSANVYLNFLVKNPSARVKRTASRKNRK